MVLWPDVMRGNKQLLYLFWNILYFLQSFLRYLCNQSFRKDILSIFLEQAVYFQKLKILCLLYV